MQRSLRIPAQHRPDAECCMSQGAAEVRVLHQSRCYAAWRCAACHKTHQPRLCRVTCQPCLPGLRDHINREGVPPQAFQPLLHAGSAVYRQSQCHAPGHDARQQGPQQLQHKECQHGEACCEF